MKENNTISKLTFGKKFKLGKKLGSGAFGDIYEAYDSDNQQKYAAKLEKASTKHPQIFFEAKLYNYLNHDSKQDKGFPKVYYSNCENNYNCMIMDQLGGSLEDLFQKHKRKFSLKTVCMLGEQMVDRIEYIHTKMFLHRDIKPDNFLMGAGGKQHKVYMIDLGLAKRFIGKDGKHIPYKENKNLTGTARYASVNTHIGIEQARRDDLESLGYVLMYFLRGVLPWQNLKPNGVKKDKYELIMNKKMSTSVESLCKGFPTQFVHYFQYCKNLKFEDKPDYSYLRYLFKDIMKQYGFENDYIYDWTKKDSNTSVQQQNSIKQIQENNYHQEAQNKPPLRKTSINAANNNIKNCNGGELIYGKQLNNSFQKKNSINNQDQQKLYQQQQVRNNHGMPLGVKNTNQQLHSSQQHDNNNNNTNNKYGYQKREITPKRNNRIYNTTANNSNRKVGSNNQNGYLYTSGSNRNITSSQNKNSLYNNISRVPNPRIVVNKNR